MFYVLIFFLYTVLIFILNDFYYLTLWGGAIDLRCHPIILLTSDGLLCPGTLVIFPLYLRTQRRSGYPCDSERSIKFAAPSEQENPSFSLTLMARLAARRASERISPSHSLWWLDSQRAERARESLLFTRSDGSTRNHSCVPFHAHARICLYSIRNVYCS